MPRHHLFHLHFQFFQLYFHHCFNKLFTPFLVVVINIWTKHNFFPIGYRKIPSPPLLTLLFVSPNSFSPLFRLALCGGFSSPNPQNLSTMVTCAGLFLWRNLPIVLFQPSLILFESLPNYSLCHNSKRSTSHGQGSTCIVPIALLSFIKDRIMLQLELGSTRLFLNTIPINLFWEKQSNVVVFISKTNLILLLYCSAFRKPLRHYYITAQSDSIFKLDINLL